VSDRWVVQYGIPLVLAVAGIVALVLAITHPTPRAPVAKSDGLRALPSWDYTNKFPDIGMEVVCTHRGKGKLDRNKGPQIGDVLVVRCEAKKLTPPGPVG
jgi:hypothetical protein